MSAVRSLLFNALFFSWTALFLTGMWAFMPFPRRVMHKAVRFWAQVLQGCLQATVGLSYEVRGTGNLPEGPVIFACKHQSAWETYGFFIIFERVTYVLKKELLSIPFWGQCARKCGAVSVDRDGGASALKDMVRDIEKRLGEGQNIVLFPEGSRAAPGTRLPYQPGVAAVYKRGKAPVVPVALNSGCYWGRRSFLKRPGTIVVEFLAPMPEGLDRKAFMAELENRIETATEKLIGEAEQ